VAWGIAEFSLLLSRRFESPLEGDSSVAGSDVTDRIVGWVFFELLSWEEIDEVLEAYIVFGAIGESVLYGTSAVSSEASSERPSLSLSVVASSSLLVHEILGSGSPGLYAAMASNVTDRFIPEGVEAEPVMLCGRFLDRKDEGDMEKGIARL
jgi:hypothetical protein